MEKGLTRRELMKLFGISTAGSAKGLLQAKTGREVNSRSDHVKRPLRDEGETVSNVSGLATSSAHAVITRLIGARANDFDLEWMPTVEGRMAYHISASGGRVSVKGTSGVAIARGAYVYLREAARVMVTWSGRHEDLPRRFPDFAPRRVVCPYLFTQYFNIVTFGYSTPFWNWSRWEQELDWMALHGISMALALAGQDAIWYRVWKSFGLTETELDRFSTGPAYLPWHWLGNINEFDGPLPKVWMAQQAELQQVILRRMRELGITPIAPAFAGFVPKGFKRVFPEAKMFTLLWSRQAGIPRLTKTFMLHPDEASLYKEIGSRFIKEYRKEFGPVDYYLADLFNELEPPVSVHHRYEDLARFAEAVYGGIVAADPNGTWVMQGWLFIADPQFWDSQSIQAFLSRIPDDRMIIVQYTSDLKGETKHPIWKATDAFFGKQWMNGMIQTFGGNNNVRGDLPKIAARPAETLANPGKGKLVGWALWPEGIENNEAVYELMTDVGWSEKPIELKQWVAGYCRARYGRYPEAMREAWNLLVQSAYGPDSSPWGSHFNWQKRPTIQPTTFHAPELSNFHQAVIHFLSCAGELDGSQLYRNDLIELVAQYAAVGVDHHLSAACAAHRAGQFQARNRMAHESLEMLSRIDGLMHLRADRRLEAWVRSARRHAFSPDELAYYDSESRRLLTFWGWVNLNDYAARVWAGLIRDYYCGRWGAFFQGLEDGHPVSMEIWEQAWLTWPYAPSPARPVPDLIAEAKMVVEICKEWYSR